MALFEQRLAQLEAIVYGSKFLSELATGTPQPGDRVGFFNSNLNRHEQIEWSAFVGLAGSSGVTFDQTGDFWNVKVNGSTVFQVSKIGQTGQYADILNAPPLGDYQLKSEKGVANGYVPTDSNNKIPESYLPSLAIKDFVDVAETTLTNFVSNQASYTFQQGDIIILDNGNGQNYWYKGGDKSLEASYSEVYVNNTPTLQQVSDQGATTNNEIESTNSFKSPQFKISNSGFEAILSALLTASRNISFQDKDQTVATLDDVTAAAILAKLLTVDGTGSGLDADLLDGVDSSRVFFGDNSRKSTNIEGILNIDDIVSTGSYRPDPTDPSNPGGVHSQIFHIQHPTTDSFAFQMGLNYSSSTNWYIRNKHAANTFNSWSEIWHSGKAVRSSILSGYTTPLPLASLGNNDWMTKDQYVKNSSGIYKSLVVVLNQTGTSNPNATVLHNNLGVTPSFTRTGVGGYAITVTGQFTLGRTIISHSFNQGSSQRDRITISTLANSVFIQHINSSGSLEDGLNNLMIEVKVYP